MRTSAKLGLTALLAAMMLSAVVGAASARNLSISNQRFLVFWSRLEFREPIGFLVVRCRVTLDGSFHERTIVKSRGSLIGAVTRVDVDKNNCTGGQALAKGPFPWHVTYDSFTGALPNITTVRIALSRFRFLLISPGAATCEYGNATDNVVGSVGLTGSEVTSLVPVEGSNTATFIEGTGPCPATGRLVTEASDRGVVTLLNSNTRIRITLI